MKKWFYNQDKKNNWQASLYNFIYIHFIKWKWLSLFISLTITISIFAYTQIEIYNNNENEWIRIFNQISITFIAGGGFSFFIRFFQHANIYKNELKKVILEEDLHIEKSRKERDNFFIDNLEIYSKFFLFKSFIKFIKRFFPEDFESLFGHNFDETIINRISNDLMISKTNNYVQKNADLKFTIKKYDDKNIILTQKFSADIYMVKDSIIFSRTYYNWVPNNHNINREKLVDIKEFKLGNVDYKENFIYLEDDGIEESIYKQIK
ncbi:MAG: hypothetical protein PSN34_14110, partial [Urechidicola sp.]|nr:hypothetical protein [Urechidicola sp.]